MVRHKWWELGLRSEISKKLKTNKQKPQNIHTEGQLLFKADSCGHTHSLVKQVGLRTEQSCLPH